MFYLGIDLGQRRDHTAIALVGRWNTVLEVRYLERLALGTPYTVVTARVQRLVEDVRLAG